MKRNTYEATMKSGAKVRFRAKAVSIGPNEMRWDSWKDQESDRLMRMDIDELVSLVRLR